MMKLGKVILMTSALLVGAIGAASADDVKVGTVAGTQTRAELVHLSSTYVDKVEATTEYVSRAAEYLSASLILKDANGAEVSRSSATDFNDNYVYTEKLPVTGAMFAEGYHTVTNQGQTWNAQTYTTW